MLIISLAFAPVLALGLFMYLKDKYAREPLKWLIIAFIIGCFSILPAIFIERLFLNNLQNLAYGDFLSLFINAFIIVALTEELSKFVLLKFVFYKKRFFSEPINGIVYAVMLSLGFAFAESVLYLINAENVFKTAIIRSFTAVPAHFTFAVFMGYYMGKARFTYSNKRVMLILTGLILAVIVHGTYDFFLMAYWMPGDFQFISFGFLLAAIIIAALLINNAQKNSPFVKRHKWLKHIEKSKGNEFQNYLKEMKEKLKEKLSIHHKNE